MKIRIPFPLSLLILCTSTSSADVVRLHDGTVLRGPTVASEAALCIDTVDGRREIATADIASIESAETLRRDWIRSFKKLRPSDWEGALRACDSAIQAGLFDEALEAADRALARALESSEPVRYVLPPDFDRLPVAGVSFDATLTEDHVAQLYRAIGSTSTPATARLAATRLLQRIEKSSDALSDTLADGLNDDSAAVREAVLRALAITTPSRLRGDVVERMLFDSSPTVRSAAIATTAAYRAADLSDCAAANDASPFDVALPIARALGTDDPPLREAAMDAIDSLELTRTVGALIRNLRRADGAKVRGNLSSITHTSYVSDFDVEIAQAAVIGQPIVKVVQSGVVHDVAVAGVFGRDISGPERSRIISLLSKLTGQNLGSQGRAWSDWLEQQPSSQTPSRSDDS